MTDRPNQSPDRSPDRSSAVRTPIADGGEPADRGGSTGGPGFESGDGSHHPGPPRFVTAGEGIVDPNGRDMETRDDLAPWNPDADGEYAWSVVDAPDGSTAEPTDDPVAEFVPDVPGIYTLALDAPDGTHELTVRAFPPGSEDAPRPQVSLDATVEGDRIELSATATLAGDPDNDLAVEYYVDDRDDAEVSPDGTIAVDDVTDRTRVYAVAVGEGYSLPDAVELVPADADASGDDREGQRGIRVERPFDPPEWVRDAIVYEIFTRRFPDQDDPTFESIADRLDHLADLGVDVLWLTPFLEAESGFGTPMELGGPHGYNTKDYFGVDSNLGTIEDFEALVEACHDRDIRVVFDLVINHTADTHPFYAAAVDESHPDHDRYRDWYRWEDFEAREPDTYFDWEGLPNLNYANPETREYLLDVVDFWAETVDGFRTDVAWGVPLNFWTEVSDRLANDDEFFLLDETLPSDVEMGGPRFHMHHDDVLHDTLERIGENVAPGADGGDGANDGAGDGVDEGDGDDRAATDEEEDAVADLFIDSSVSSVPAAEAILDAIGERERRGAHPASEWLLYVENHDTDRYLGEYGRDAQRAAGAATFTLPGSPMLYQGQETGMRNYRDPMNWGDFDEEQLTYHRRLLELRREDPALRTDATIDRISYEGDTDAAVAFARTAPAGDRRVVVAIHFGEGTAAVSVDEPIEATDLLTGDAAADPETGEVAVDSVVVVESGR